MSNQEKVKVPVVGYVALIFAILFFSGLLPQVAKATAMNWINAFDFGKLQGVFGNIAGSKNTFAGVGGDGAKGGFIFALTLVPSVMFALGFIEVVSNYGGLKAAQKLLTPLLRPLLGIPGVTGLALISSLQSTDAGGSMTKALRETDDITESEKTVFAMFQLSAGATITNFLSSGAAIIDIVDDFVPTIILISFVVMFVLKLFGANLMRFVVLKFMGGENE